MRGSLDARDNRAERRRSNHGPCCINRAEGRQKHDAIRQAIPAIQITSRRVGEEEQIFLHRPSEPGSIERWMENCEAVTKLTLSDSMGPIERLLIDSAGVWVELSLKHPDE